MTDGILLAEIQRDRLLTGYDTLIIDEAHERSLNIDFILGYLKQLLPRRPDLKVIVTSATIDTERFAAHFGRRRRSSRCRAAPTRSRSATGPLGDEPTTGTRPRPSATPSTSCATEGPGDILVFLSGEREIRDTADALAAAEPAGATEILPLYARLSAAEQHRVFQPHPGRRIVLATNVAETSLDRARASATWSTRARPASPATTGAPRCSACPSKPVSQASANQRAGRCGRVGARHLHPPLRRGGLRRPARVHRARDPAHQPGLGHPPDGRPRPRRRGRASRSSSRPTPAASPTASPCSRSSAPSTRRTRGRRRPRAGSPRLGRRLARLPLDPRLGRMVLEADRHGCVREVMVIAAALSIQDPRERPAEHQQAAAELHARFADADSDFLAYLKLWEHLAEQQEALVVEPVPQAVPGRVPQLPAGPGVAGHPRPAPPGRPAASASPCNTRRRRPPDRIHLSLLAGLLSHIGIWDGTTRDYHGARDARFALAPGSSLVKTPPRWVMAAELVETNRLWARVAARIQPEWVERLGGHLVKRSYSEPWWDAERGAAMADERVTLYGLPIVTARRVSYGRVDPAGARELFIRHALVRGRVARPTTGSWPTTPASSRRCGPSRPGPGAGHPRRRRRRLRLLRRARPGRRSPRPATSTGGGGTSRRRTPDRLDFTLEELIDPGAGRVDLADFPDTWPAGDLDPGADLRVRPGVGIRRRHRRRAAPAARAGSTRPASTGRSPASATSSSPP